MSYPGQTPTTIACGNSPLWTAQFLSWAWYSENQNSTKFAYMIKMIAYLRTKLWNLSQYWTIIHSNKKQLYQCGRWHDSCWCWKGNSGLHCLCTCTLKVYKVFKNLFFILTMWVSHWSWQKAKCLYHYSVRRKCKISSLLYG